MWPSIPIIIAQAFSHVPRPAINCKLVAPQVDENSDSTHPPTQKKIAGAVELRRFSSCSLPPDLAAREKRLRTGLIFRPDAEQRRLRFGKLSQFLHLVHHSALRLVLFTLHPALCLLALFLLPGLFFLAFSKSRSSSWHSQFLLSSIACGADSPLYARPAASRKQETYQRGSRG